MKNVGKIIFSCLCLLLFGCESIDCTLNNVVACYIGFYDSATGTPIALADTLSVTAEGTDSVLYNKGVRTGKLAMPMSFWQDADALNLHIWGEDYDYSATVVLNKTNHTHYESPDCPTTMFHHITSTSFSSAQALIDSVTITRPSVNYETTENIRIYFRTAD